MISGWLRVRARYAPGEPSVVPGWGGAHNWRLGAELCPEAPTSVLRLASQAGTLPGEKKRPSCSHADGDARKTSRVCKPRLLARRGRCLSLACTRVRFARGERARETQLGPHQAVVRGGKRGETGQAKKLIVACRPEDSRFLDLGADIW